MMPETFKAGMGFMFAYLGVDPAVEKVPMYWEMLKHLPDDTFDKAIKNALQEFIPTAACPFPLVAHILKYCGEAGESKAVNAISTLKRALKHGPYQSICFEDSALHYTVESFGGWPALCNWTAKEWDINEGRIIETYRSALMGGRTGATHLAGLSERSDGYFSLFFLPTNGDKPKSIRCRGSVPELTFNPAKEIQEKTMFQQVDSMVMDISKRIGASFVDKS